MFFCTKFAKSELGKEFHLKEDVNEFTCSNSFFFFAPWVTTKLTYFC